MLKLDKEITRNLSSRVRLTTCAAWVRRGVAKQNPDKVELTEDDLAQFFKLTKENLRDLEDETKNAKETSEKEDCSAMDIEKRYNLDDYDTDGDIEEEELASESLQDLAVHSSSKDDPYITIKDEDDSDDENHQIKPSDNLIAVGVAEKVTSLLEVYVYNSEEGSLYVHHDIILPDDPICMEWLSYDREGEQVITGNMLAIGTMSPFIDVWDLDIVNATQPSYVLGRAENKEKNETAVGHTDSVLSLSWNKYADHVLASGSVDQTVLLWDLEYTSVAQHLTSFDEKVQSVQWHHEEAHTLLTGACDRKVRIFDCRASDDFKTWELDGEVECTIWQTTSADSYTCLASTEEGTVFGIDVRQEKPLWTLKAHDQACTAIQMSPTCPGCLVTVSADGCARVWDIKDGEPHYVEQYNPGMGVIQCLAACPDAPFVFCAGGQRKKNLDVFDIGLSYGVRRRFCKRIGLPLHMDGDGATRYAPLKAAGTGAKPKPKFRKKKGGHLDKKKKKQEK